MVDSDILTLVIRKYTDEIFTMKNNICFVSIKETYLSVSKKIDKRKICSYALFLMITKYLFVSCDHQSSSAYIVIH